MSSFTITSTEQSVTGSAVVIKVVAPAECSTNVDDAAATTKAGSEGGVTPATAASRRPHDLHLQTTFQQRGVDFSCHQEQQQQQQDLSCRQAARRTLRLSSPLGLCARHPSTPQPVGTCCFQDGRRDFDKQCQVHDAAAAAYVII
jgi:hypothetical protein